MLREKRRRETARDIQHATLELALAHGLDNITTEEIAAAAGVSTRTFFNYYPNKEAAAIGSPPGHREEDKAALRDGTRPLDADLKWFLGRHIAALAEDERTLHMVRKVVQSNAKASAVLRLLWAEREELTDCLDARVKDRQVAMALADIAVGCITRAIHLWESEEAVPLQSAFDRAWAGQIAASRVLAQPSD